jgi:RTX calcium-binding nonapeptide repeat (4 copies)
MQFATAENIDGMAGDDVITDTAGAGCIVGGDGNDSIVTDSSLRRGAVDGGTWIEGGPGNDTITATGGADSIRGASGNDVLSAGAGDDRIDGGAGNDIISGGRGNDIISGGAGDNVIRGGPGNDLISSNDGSREVVDCGPGDDIVHADRNDRLVGCERVKHRPSPYARVSPHAGSLRTIFTLRYIEPYSTDIPPNDEGIASYEYRFVRAPSATCHPELSFVSPSLEVLGHKQDRLQVIPRGTGCRGVYRLAIDYYNSTLEVSCNSISGAHPRRRGDLGSCPFTETVDYFNLRIR